MLLKWREVVVYGIEFEMTPWMGISVVNGIGEV